MDLINKIKAWLSAKWQWVVGAFVGIIALAATFYKRDAHFKKNFENLKKNTEAEKDIVENAAKEIVEESEKIRDIAEESKKQIIKSSEKAEEKLKKEKKEFFDDNKKSDTLAQDLANELGVDFVKTE